MLRLQEGMFTAVSVFAQVILSCVYGTATTARLKQQGMEFAVWVFKHADDAQLQPHSNVILQNLLRLLNEGELYSIVAT